MSSTAHKDHEKLQDEASEWIVRLSSDVASEDTHHEFALWLGISPAHRDAYDAVEALWFDLGCVKYSAPELEEQPQNASTAIDSSATGRLHRFSEKLGETGRKLGAFGITALVASLLWLGVNPNATELTEQHYATSVGKQKTITLPDGSRVQLNTNTRLQMHFTDELRLLTLHRGEAYFEVAKDKERPLKVLIPGASVTAIGTAFNIDVSPSGTLVAVTEGVIRVEEERNLAINRPAVTADLNDLVDIDNTSGISISRDVELANTLAWQQQDLIFEQATLAEVVSELNRYSDVKIKIADASIAYLPISGVFKLTQPLKALEAIESSLELERSDQGDLILLYKRS